MVILKRLYSETKLFDEIVFKEGINFILGGRSIAKNENKESSKAQTFNGIGKSSVVRIIDLAFVGTGSKKIFLQSKYRFLFDEVHSFTLEFEINEQLYSIKRLFQDKTIPTYFKKNYDGYQEYEENELKTKLGQLFFLNDNTNSIVENSWFRDLIRFFVKDDINRQGRIDPIDFMSDGKFKLAILKVFYKNFYLLGLPNEKIIAYEVIEEIIKDKKKHKNALIKDIEKTTSYEHLKSQQFEMEKDIAVLEKVTENYRFEPKYEISEKKLTILENKVSEKLLLRNKLLKEKTNYEKSLKINLETDVEKAEKIYTEINTELGIFIKKILDDVIDFRQKISQNRKVFLQKRQAVIKEELEKLLQEIIDLETQRETIYKTLNEKKALDSLKNTFQELIIKKSELEKNKIELKKIDVLDLEISKEDKELKSVKTEIVEVIQEIDETIKKIRALFYEVLENTIFFDEDKTGFAFEIANTSKGKPLKFEVDVPKSDSKGNKFFKLMAYDLTVFLNIIRQKRNMPHFLIHDGVYDEIEPSKTIKTLNFINAQTRKYPNFQYIVVANEYELEISEADKEGTGNYDFSFNIIAEFSDDPSKMFFKRSFT